MEPIVIATSEPSKIAVFLPNWVGDAVMATPALRALRDRYDQAEFLGVVRPPIGEVLDGTGLVDRLVTWNPRGANREEKGFGLIRRLRKERIDLAVLFPNSLRSGWLAWCSGARRRVGFARNGRGILLTDAVSPRSRNRPHPVMGEYLRLAGHLGCSRLTRTMELATSAESESDLDSLLTRHRHPHVATTERARAVPSGRRQTYVALNPGGAYGAAKHWPAAHFAELARRIAVELGRNVLVLCGPAERELAREIATRANHPSVTSLADARPSIGLTKSAVRNADLLVTTDSGPRHFAPPFHVPVVTLFGPTHIEWSETFAENAVHLQIPVECGPCQQRTCPLGHHHCMTELRVEYVFAAVVSLLDSAERRTAISA